MSKSDAAWAREISNAWNESIAAIFKVGDMLRAAKKELRGRFEEMVRTQLPFRERTAQCLMKIAGDKRLREKRTVVRLPPHWRTLAEISGRQRGLKLCPR
jgi:hypothetical protein